MNGLRFNGYSDYLQLPSMQMDAIEIECKIDSVQPKTTQILFDARSGSTSDVASDAIVNVSSLLVNGVVITQTWASIPKDAKIRIRIETPAFTDDVTLMARFSEVAGNRFNLKATLYTVKCYLAGVLQCAYDFMNNDTAIDVSGNGRNGTLVGGTPVVRKAKTPIKSARTPIKPVQQGLRFDGISDYVNAGNTNVLPSNFAIEATFTTYVTGIKQVIVGKYGSYGITIDSTGVLKSVIWGNDWLTNYTVLTNTPVTVKFMNRPTEGKQYLFANGVQVDSRTTTLNAPNSAQSFYIGDWNGVTSDRKFRGIVHNIKISDDSNIKSEYRFNEGTGTTLTDYSGNGNHGTITGASWIVKDSVRVLPVR